MNFKKTRVLLIYLVSVVFTLFTYSAWANNVSKIGYIGRGSGSAFLGLQQGLVEANLQAKFLGQTFELQHLTLDNNVDTLSKILAVVVDTQSAGELVKLVKQFPAIPILNLTLEDDQVRTNCHNNLFHIIPNKKMKQDALKQWRKQSPGSTKAIAHAWHPSFEKYAALQLNQRYTKSTGKMMDDEAWSGWAGAKLITDSIMRIDNPTPERLTEFLRTQLAFDGQKGSELNFRKNGQLNQIILIEDNNKIVAEAPIKSLPPSGKEDILGQIECHPQ